MVSHAEREHALLSASGSERWINCPASPRLEEQLPEETSVYAEEGTLAHELAEFMLKVDLKLITMSKYREDIERLKKHALYSDSLIDPIMEYVNYIKQQFAEAKRIDPKAFILIETRFDLRNYVEMGFGTSDCIIVRDGHLEVIDLKFGAGKLVSPVNNSQFMYYGLGALESLSAMAKRMHNIKLTAVQPRMSNIASWDISLEDLRNWGDEVLRPKAAEAYSGDGAQVPGDWCQFCKVRPRCRALHDRALQEARRDFEELEDPKLINDEELLILYKNADFISKFLSDVKALVLKEALAGKDWQGYKLVEGKSNRQITDETKVREILEAELYEPKDFLNTKLKGLGDLEKLLKKSVFEQLLGHLVVKPAGAPTLVDESDKRLPLAVSRISKDFEDLEDDLN
jgi:hypothetical protein